MSELGFIKLGDAFYKGRYDGLTPDRNQACVYSRNDFDNMHECERRNLKFVPLTPVASGKELGQCGHRRGDIPHTRKDDCVNWQPLVTADGGVSVAKPALRSYTSAERKEMPVQEVMANYFPDAFAALARHSKKANDKHNPGEPMHWARHKSSDHLNCAGRHLLTPDEINEDTGEIELVAAAWRCLAAVQLREEKRLVAAGIRPLSGVIDG
jgi:hypothetical protein